MGNLQTQQVMRLCPILNSKLYYLDHLLSTCNCCKSSSSDMYFKVEHLSIFRYYHQLYSRDSKRGCSKPGSRPHGSGRHEVHSGALMNLEYISILISELLAYTYTYTSIRHVDHSAAAQQPPAPPWPLRGMSAHSCPQHYSNTDIIFLWELRTCIAL